MVCHAVTVIESAGDTAKSGQKPHVAPTVAGKGSGHREPLVKEVDSEYEITLRVKKESI